MINEIFLKNTIYELIVATVTDLSNDIEIAIRNIFRKEKTGRAKMILETILENISIARNTKTPICQDTGLLNFYVKAFNEDEKHFLEKAVFRSVKKATSNGILRPNLISPVTGKRNENNIGNGSPSFFYENGKHKDIYLMLKGGGSENVSAQFSLPNEELNADRNLDGVMKCVLKAIFDAQGKGCSPGVAGVCVGGDRAHGFEKAMFQHFRKLDDKNPDPRLSKLESKILNVANSLNIGAMGLGGNSTLLGCKIIELDRHIASFFVTVSYMCWADRRRGIRIDDKGRITKWLI